MSQQTVHARGRGPPVWQAEEGTTGRDIWDQAEEWGTDIEEPIARSTFAKRRSSSRRERLPGRSWSSRSPRRILVWLLGLGVVAVVCLGAYGSGYRLMRPPELQLARSVGVQKGTIPNRSYGIKRRSNIQLEGQEQQGEELGEDDQVEDAAEEELELPDGSDATEAALLVRNAQLKMAGLANKGTTEDDDSLSRPAKPRRKTHRSSQRNRKKKGAAGGSDSLPSDGTDTTGQIALESALGRQEPRKEGSATAEIAEEIQPVDGLGQISVESDEPDEPDELGKGAIQEDYTTAAEKEAESVQAFDTMDQEQEVDSTDQVAFDDPKIEPIVVSGAKAATVDLLGVFLEGTSETIMEKDGVINADEDSNGKADVIRTAELSVEKIPVSKQADKEAIAKPQSTNVNVEQLPHAEIQHDQEAISFLQSGGQAGGQLAQKAEGQVSEAGITGLQQAAQGLEAQAASAENTVGGGEGAMGQLAQAVEPKVEVKAEPGQHSAGGVGASAGDKMSLEAGTSVAVDALHEGAEAQGLPQAQAEPDKDEAGDEFTEDDEVDRTVGLEYSLVPEDVEIPTEPISDKAKTLAALQHYTEVAEAAERKEREAAAAIEAQHKADEEARRAQMEASQQAEAAQAAAVAAEKKAKADAESIAWEAQQSVKDAAKLQAVDAEIMLAAKRVAAQQAEDETSRAKKADGQAGTTSAEQITEGGGQGANRQQQSTAALQRPDGETLDAFIARTEHLSSEHHNLEGRINDPLMPVRQLLQSLL